MNRRIGLAAASVTLGALAAVAVPASAQAAETASWQPTGEYYRYKSTCMADADYYLAASNVYGYRCDQLDTNLWRGMVYAD